MADEGGAGDQVGLVLGQEAQHGRLQRSIARLRAQRLGGQARQVQQAVRPGWLVEDPDQGGQRDDGGLIGIKSPNFREICIDAGHGLSYSEPEVNSAVNKKVAIVEDNELNLRLFRDLLQAHGVKVEAVGDARDAMARIGAFAPDLVIMDIQLPHISGIDLIRQMKSDASLQNIPVMAVTAYAGKGDEARVREAGADAYVAKPISVARFISSVEGLLGALSPNMPAVAGMQG